MKTKLLFAAALMAASAGGAQAVWAGENRMLSSFSEVTGEATPLADVELPTPLAFYDFENEAPGWTFKQDGNGTLPAYLPFSESETVLRFTQTGSWGDSNYGYLQIDNPFNGNENVVANGATVSLWTFLNDNTLNRSIWGFGQGAGGYENYPKLSLGGDAYLVYNRGINDDWIDFNRGGVHPIPANQMAMVTVTLSPTSYSLYINGASVEWSTTGNGSAGVDALLGSLLTHMTTDFPYFYVGKGGFEGTFGGYADKLGLYDRALTAEEVAALYEEQKVGYENPLDIDMDAREDVTSYITNADFSNEEDMWTGWTNEGMACDAGISAEEGMPFMNEDPGTAMFNFYQTIEVPNGLYNISAQVLTHANGVVFLYANSNQTTVPQYGGAWSDDMAREVIANWSTNKEDNRVSVSTVEVTDGTLSIGVIKNNARKGFVCFDNFRLEKASLNEVLALYGPVSINAQALDQSLLPDALKNLLNEALQKTPAEITVDAYVEAYLALQPVYEVCDYYVENDILAYLTTCKSDLANSTGADDTALENAISALETIDWNTITVDELQQAYNLLVETHHAYQAAATPTGDYQFDMTYLLTNPCSTGETTGWACNVLGGDPGRYNTNVGISGSASYIGDADVTCFVEKWSANVLAPAEDGNGWLIFQQVALPAGAYKVTALAFTDMPHNAQNDVTGEAVANLSMGFGSTVTVDGEAFDWQEHEKMPQGQEVPIESNQNQLKLMTIPYFYLNEAATAENPVKLGINIKEGNMADWFGINDMKLYKVAPKPVELTLDETEAYSVTADTYANVTLKRNLKADGKWNTFCVPFDMTAEQLTANGISEVRRFSGVSASGNSVILTAETVSDGVKAGVPYIVQVNSNVSEIKVDDVTVQAAAPTAQSIGFAQDLGFVYITGNYSATTVPQGAYFISDNIFYVADAASAVTLNGFRAYITVEEGNEASQVNRLLIDIDGEVTAIEDVLGEAATDGDKPVDVYTLSGVKVKSGVKKAEALDGLQRGIYIVDGQKMTK